MKKLIFPALAQHAFGRREFMQGVASAALVSGCGAGTARTVTRSVSVSCSGARVCVDEVGPGEDLFSYIQRVRGRFDRDLYCALLGAANEYKEGDDALGLAADGPRSRSNARALLANTTIGALSDRPLLEDDVHELIVAGIDRDALERIRPWKMSELEAFVLTRSDSEIQEIMPGLPSDIIGMLVKLLDDDELVHIGRTVFNPLPGSNIGAKGYMGARIQPNSPTDHPSDILWQVLNGWAFAVGDVVLGNNPVSSEPASVHAVEVALKDALDAFGLSDVMPHCCLSHIDVQAQVEDRFPGSTALWFQSLGSSVEANAVFDVTVEKMLAHADRRTGKYGLYFETGQGADATNGAAAGFDMVIHEARKYGFARALRARVALAQRRAGREAAPWIHVNDVAGFIGPEVFRTREQLVRCCLEDIAMGKLHGLTIGLDVCSTLHMDIGLDDLDWCLDRIMPANPAYIMALPTKNDPMLSYLTTSFQDHVRIRERFGYKVDDRMWRFFQNLGVIDERGRPTEHFGDVRYVYAKYRKAKGDPRSLEVIMRAADTQQSLAEVRGRGVWIAEGHGARVWDLQPELERYIRTLVADGKRCLLSELPAEYVAGIPAAVVVRTNSADRTDYILHPPTGEEFPGEVRRALELLRDQHAGAYDVQLMISDGLNAHAITDEGHVSSFLPALRAGLETAGYRVAPQHIVCTSGRVRAGYRAGEILFGALDETAGHRAMVHIIGERPGSEHHSFSVYVSAPSVEVWRAKGRVDHDITRVVANIADTALTSERAAEQVLDMLRQLFPLQPRATQGSRTTSR